MGEWENGYDELGMKISRMKEEEAEARAEEKEAEEEAEEERKPERIIASLVK